MRYILPILAIGGFALAGCFPAERKAPPGHVKHMDGPGNSENAPGQMKKK